MDFIHINSKTGDGGFLIHNDEVGREIANELLKDPKYIEDKEFLKPPLIPNKMITQEMKDDIIYDFPNELLKIIKEGTNGKTKRIKEQEKKGSESGGLCYNSRQ